MPVVLLPQFPLGTYDVTFLPLIKTDSELDGVHEPVSGGGGGAIETAGPPPESGPHPVSAKSQPNEATPSAITVELLFTLSPPLPLVLPFFPILTREASNLDQSLHLSQEFRASHLKDAAPERL